ncbi:MAG TPA: RNA polymerase factor sigma-54 [Bacteroidales bacterium]|nr:RNA polymerase factor sigma-54 [Bacteroidales bacterium]
MLSQRLQQKLLQKLSPQQIQLMKLIQIPTVALEQRIKQEIEENPALEEASEENEESQDEFGQDSDNENEYDDEGDERLDDFDFEDYLDDDDIPAYKLTIQNRGRDEEEWEAPVVSGVSFHEHLQNQAGMLVLNDRQRAILDVIIGNIDDSGYLERELPALVNDLSFSFNISTSVKELEELLQLVHQLDPPGVGARNLQECLLIQLNRVEEETDATELARAVIRDFFEEFSKKHFDKILKKTEALEEELKEAVAEILKLNPKPGNTLGDTSRGGLFILPDFFITNQDGELELRVNQKNKPELRVNKAYREMLEHYAADKSSRGTTQRREALQFVKQKIDSAKWFIEAINQREQTLFITMSAIMEFQREYFLSGDETRLKPMILKDIAELVGLDISTVSRVANSKYVQTTFGTFLLKTLFSEGLQTESGEEVSSREVKKILEECIGSEDKRNPVTDDALSLILKERGYTLARRTVAKYREQLGIPVARMRRAL